MMINLDAFCYKFDDRKPALEKPFRHGDWIYATDGRIIARIPASPDDELSETLNHPNVPSVKGLASFNFQSEDGAPCGWKPLPPDLPEPQPIADCDDCDDCDGTGEVECDMGFQHVCDNCDGDGKVTPKDQPVDIGFAKASDRYLRIIAALPGAQIAANGERFEAIPFRFNGGCGLLMPMRIEP